MTLYYKVLMKKDELKITLLLYTNCYMYLMTPCPNKEKEGTVVRRQLVINILIGCIPSYRESKRCESKLV